MISGKRIIIVLGSFELGGSERQALLLAHRLMGEQGAHVQIWGLNIPGCIMAECDKYGIPWRIVSLSWPRNPVKFLWCLAKFVWMLRQARPDVILPYTMFSNKVCGLTWRMAGARLCVWNQRDEGIGHTGRKFERWAVCQTPLFVSNSQHGADFLVRTLGVRPDKVRVVHNGIELAEPESSRAEWRNRLGVDENCFLVCMLANLSVFKDHVTLLNAWTKVVKQLDAAGRTAILLLAGRFDDTSKTLKTLVRKLELGDSVRFLGQVNDISGLLGAAELGVLSSRSEGCPNSVLEYMAAGLAVAGTDIPGIREAIGPGGYLFLSPPGNADGLADRIMALATNEELCAKLGAENRHRIKTEFTPQRMCEEMVTLICEGFKNGFHNRFNL